MKISPLTKEAIEAVFSDLSEVSEKDMEFFNLTFDEMKGGFTERIGEPFCVAFYTDEGQCCALLMMVLIDINRWRAYFVNTRKNFSQIAVALTKFLKGISNSIIIKDRGYIEFLSTYRDGKPYRWFSSMGFQFQYQKGNSYLYTKQAR